MPLTGDHEPGVAALVDDEDVRRYTRVPTKPSADFAAGWLARYEDGWRDGSRAGFAIEDRDGEFLGLGLFVRIDGEGRQGEIGYVVGPAARGRGVAARTLRLLTDWGFSQLGLMDQFASSRRQGRTQETLCDDVSRRARLGCG